MTIQKLIDNAIRDELKDCMEWYKDFMNTEYHLDIKTLDDMENAITDIEAQDDFENVIFSAGFVSGMRCIKRIAEEQEKRIL